MKSFYRPLWLWLFICLLTCAPPAHSMTYKFTTIDAPSLSYTYPQGINNAGQIVGFSGTSGFLWSGGSFTILDCPGIDGAPPADWTQPSAINDAGQIVGSYGYSSFGGSLGFLSSGGVYANLGYDTFPRGINDAGQIVGYYFSQGAHGFLLDLSFNTLDAPGPDPKGTFVFGINNAGQIVGSYDNLTGTYAFSGMGYTTFAVPGATHTNPRGINSFGHIVGYYDTETYPRGFFLGGGSYADIFFPGAIDTYATGINDAGQIVGYYFNAGYHGFLATPIRHPHIFSLLLLDD